MNVFVTSDVVQVFGGQLSNGTVLSDIWTFDVQEGFWSTVALREPDPNPGSHFGAKAFVYVHFIVLSGGSCEARCSVSNRVMVICSERVGVVGSELPAAPLDPSYASVRWRFIVASTVSPSTSS